MAKLIGGTNDPNYLALRRIAGGRGVHNGAYYYAKEIEHNIAPFIETDRAIDPLGLKAVGGIRHGAIIFIHHCLNWDKVYSWLERYSDIILVVSTKPTLEWAKSKGYKAIFLPLTIDVDYVKKFAAPKTKKACYAGNRWAFKMEQENKNIPDYVEFPPSNMRREELLKFIAQYEQCYAIGRCALEAKVLGCEIMPFLMDRYPDPSYWVIRDNSEAVEILQRELDALDKK